MQEIGSDALVRWVSLGFGRGQHSTLFSSGRPRCPGFDSLGSQKFSEEKIFKVAVVNQWYWLDESGQWLENVERSHVVLVSGKLVLQESLGILGPTALTPIV